MRGDCLCGSVKGVLLVAAQLFFQHDVVKIG